MADVFTSQKRSEIMSRVKGYGNRATELRLVELLRNNSINGWRRKFPLYGKPDFVFPKQRLVVFVDGCFWHGCQSHGTLPQTNSEFWLGKLERNKARDRAVNRELRRQGWRILRLWQHEFKDPAKVIRKVQRCVTSNL